MSNGSPHAQQRPVLPTTPPPTPVLHPEIRSIVKLNLAHTRKVYYSGPLVRHIEKLPDGRPPHIDEGWTEVWARLSGTTLNIWDMKQIEEANRQGTEVPPTYVNVNDAFVNVLGSITISATPPRRFSNVLTLNTAGSNLLLFSCPSSAALVSWAAALRLSSWEKSRLDEIYTAHLIRSLLKDGKDTPSPLVRGQIEGWVRVRIAGSTDWKKLWMVVSRGQDHPPSAVSTDTRQSAPNSPKRRISNMFRRESRAALALVLTKCQIAFYASHKPKDKRETLLTLHNVLQAYAVYPERPELINMSTLMKLEGQFGGEDMAGMRKTREGWLYVMPDLDGGFGTAREMLAWLIGIHDAFELYGRPQSYTWDPRDPVSLMFAYPMGPNRDHLFLNRELAETLDFRDERKSFFHSRLLNITGERMRGNTPSTTSPDALQPVPQSGQLAPNFNTTPPPAPRLAPLVPNLSTTPPPPHPVNQAVPQPSMPAPPALRPVQRGWQDDDDEDEENLVENDEENDEDDGQYPPHKEGTQTCSLDDLWELPSLLMEFRPPEDVFYLENPSAWLDARGDHILRVTKKNSQLSKAKKIECAEWALRGQYEGLFMYTYIHCELLAPRSAGADSLPARLQTQLGGSNDMSDIDKLGDHSNRRSVIQSMLEEIHRCSPCGDPQSLKALMHWDIFAMCVRTLAVLKHKQFKGPAQILLNVLQMLLDYPHLDPSFKGRFVKAVIQLSQNTGLYPECLVLHDVQKTGEYALTAGQFGDVWKGLIGNHEIAIKVLKVYMTSDIEKLLKTFSHEAVLWRQLSHPNILPFYGVYHWDENRSRVCLISPWMCDGNMVQYLRDHPHANRIDLAFDIAFGLEYLHGHKPCIIHGDLKGVNILIAASGAACLADFGLSAVRDSQLFSSFSSSSPRGGTLRWQAPELLNIGAGGSAVESAENSCNSSRASDMYAFACVVYEIFSGQVPFHECKHDYPVIMAVTGGQRPARPCHDRGLDDDTWAATERCWAMKPTERPHACDVAALLRPKTSRNGDQPSDCDWDQSFISRLRCNLAGDPLTFPDSVYDPSASDSASSTTTLSQGAVSTDPTLGPVFTDSE